MPLGRAEFMGIFQRYILWELAKVFFLTLGILTLLMMFVGLGEQAIREGLGIRPLLKTVPYLLPNALRFSMPGTMLFAVCTVYGRVSALNELIALKSAGISPSVAILPGLMLAFATSVLAVWLNDVAVSWGEAGVRRVVIESIEEIAYGMLRTKRAFNSERFSVLVKDVEGHKLIRPEILISRGRSEPISISAASAELTADNRLDRLIVTLTDSRIQTSSGGGQWFEHPGTMRTSISLVDDSPDNELDNSFRGSLGELPGKQRMMTNYQRDMARSIAFLGVCEALTIHPTHQTDPRMDEALKQHNWSQTQLYRLYTEPYRRWANGFSCLFFAMLGIPLAIRQRNTDFVSSFFTAFLPVLLLYYPLLAMGIDRTKAGAWYPASVWLGNVVLLIIGLWLTRRILRY